MSQLMKRLEKAQEKDYKTISEDEILKEATTLLLGAHDSDLETLRNLGLDHQIQYERKHTEDFKRTKKAEEIYGNKSFTGAQIKTLCTNFYLKLLPIDLYNGSIPSELPRVVNEFCKANEINVSTNNFFILAPTEQFKTVEHVPLSKDPILFYREPDAHTSRTRRASEKDVFTQVINWGSGFSSSRSLKILTNTYKREIGEATCADATVTSIVFFVAAICVGVFTSAFWGAVSLSVIASLILLSNMGSKNIDKLWNEETV